MGARRRLALLLGLLLGATSALAQEPTAPEPTPVRFRGETLFHIYAPTKELTPAQRAANVERRLLKLAAEDEDVLGQIRTAEAGDANGVIAGDRVVVGFGDEDARLAGRSREALAAEAAARVRDALARDFEARAAGALLRSALYALGASALLLLLLRVVWRTTRSAEARVRARVDARLARMRERGQLLSLVRVDRVLLSGVRLLRLVLSTALLVTWAVWVFGLFPWTRGLAEAGLAQLAAAGAWVLGGVADYLPNLLYIALALLVARWLLRLMRLVADEVNAGRLSVPGFFPEWAAPTYKVARVLVLALCLVVVYPYLPGSGSPAFQGVSVFLGVLVSLGSTAAIANMVAGLVITYMRPFQLHDRIRIGDSEGEVIEKTLLIVRLRTLEGSEITVPNSALLLGALQNFSAPLRRDLGLVVETSVTIGYDVPWRTVEALLLEAARTTPGIVERPPPEVWQSELQDFYVHHTLRVAVREVERRKAILATLNRRILECFFAAGVEIMSPHYVSARDGNTAAIPPEQRPPGAGPGAFRHRLVGREEEARAGANTDGPEPPGRSASERH